MKGETKLERMPEAAVKLGATSAGAQALTDYKRAFWAFHGTWKPKTV